MSILKQLSISLPLINSLEQIPEYAKFMKDVMSKKRIVSQELSHDLHHYKAIARKSMVLKKDPDHSPYLTPS